MLTGKVIGVVVPAYNEELLIADAVNSIPDYIDHIYVVNDASKDRTGDIIRSFDHKRIHYIEHPVNRGVGAAIVSGYKRAMADKVDATVVMAGDNQMDPANLVALLTPVIEGKADYAKGNRLSRTSHLAGMSPWRRLGNFTLTLLTRIASGNFSLSDPQNGYTAISLKALRNLDMDSIYPRYGYCNDMLVKLVASGAKIVDVPMPSRYGREKSKIRYHKYIPKLSWLLLKAFLWRMKFQASKQGKQSQSETI